VNPHEENPNFHENKLGSFELFSFEKMLKALKLRQTKFENNLFRV